MTDINSQTLHVVAKELAATLNEARAALETYAERPEQIELLQRCGEHLHQAHGVLRLVEVYGAALLAEEMEHVTAHLLDIDSEKKQQAEGLDALMRSMVQLPTYLERVLSGGRDLALILLPLLNDLRAVRGSPLLSEGTLLLLNLKSDQPAQPQTARPGEPPLSITQWARRLRTRFQLGLLGLIRGERIEQNLESMAKVAEKFEQVATTQPVFQLWWVTGALLEALRANGLESSATIKRLLGQADRQIKRLYEIGEARFCESPPIDLLNNMLYYVARATTSGGRIGAVRASFKLVDLLPVDSDIEQERESLSAPSVKLMHTVADAIKEDLSKVKDVLDIFVRRGGGQLEELTPQLDLLKKISETLGVLGLGELRQRVQHETGELAASIGEGHTPTEDALLKMAATLLAVEDSLDDQLVRLILPNAGGDSGPQTGDDMDFKSVTEAVLRECIVNLARVKEAVSVAVNRPGDSLQQGLDNVPQLLRGITAGLLMLGKGRAVELMDAIGTHVRKLVEPGAPTPDPARLERIADAIVSVEYYMETLQSGRSDPWYMLDNAEICIKALQEQSTQVPIIVAPAVADPAHTVKLDVAPVLPAADVHDATIALTPPVVAVPSPPPMAAEHMDPEFLELFIEEAKEEITSIQTIFPMWDQNPMDSESLITLRRAFHTLKGSGRMVGARLIGEFGWSIENLFNRLIDKTLTRTPGIMAMMRSAVAALPGLVEQLETGRPLASPVEPIMARAYAYAEGRDPDQAVTQLAEERAPAGGEFVAAKAAQNVPVAAAVQPEAVQEESAVEASAAAPPGSEPGIAADGDFGAPITADEAAPAPHFEPAGDETRISAPPPAEWIFPESGDVAPASEAAESSSAAAETTAFEPAAPTVADMDPMLHDIYSKETEGHLLVIRDYLRKRMGQPSPHDLPENVYRAIHTLSGSSKMAEARHGIRITEPLNHFMRKVFDNNRGLSDAGLMALHDSVAAIDNVVAHINEATAFFSEQPSLVQRFQVLEAELDAELDAELAREASSNNGHAPTHEPFEPEHSFVPPSTAQAEPLDFELFAEPEPPQSPYHETAAAADPSGAPAPEMPSGEPGYLDSAPEQTPYHEPPYGAPGYSPSAPEPMPDHESVSGESAPDRTPYGEPTFGEPVFGEAMHTESPYAQSEPAEGPYADVASPPPAHDDAPRAEIEPYPASPTESVVPETAPTEIAPQTPLTEAAANEEFDSEIAGIYSEEASELLEAAEVSLSGWNQDRNDRSKFAELQRQLHTLKGGARMAGVTAMGNLSHELESLVVDIDAGLVASDDRALEILQASLDELARMRDMLSAGMRVPAAGDLIGRIRMLTGAESSAARDEAMSGELAPMPPESIRTAAPFGARNEEAAPAQPEPRAWDFSATPRAEPPAPRIEIAAAASASEQPADALEHSLEPRAFHDDSLRSSLEQSGMATPPILPGRETVQPERAEMARVDADLLDTMLNNAGEVSIFRARLDQQVSSIDFNLAELARTVIRLKEQLRGLEIETEAQVLNRHEDIAPRHTDFDPLELDRYSTLQQFSRALSETSSDVASIQGLLEALTREAQNLLIQQARVITELQNGLMRTRMVPFQRHVQRLSRLVRQAANDTHKRAELAVEGAAAELDRQVLERMVPPLEHLLRNAVVHGIETPERRIVAGKPEVGRISISIERDGAEVVIVVADDGSGINVKLIREKALSLGLADPNHKLTDEEAMQLILEPGFSTAGRVTQAAGRGVGMDVVATEVKKLGGGLFIESTHGRGSRFTIRLPFTLAISQALIVRVAEEVYALPLATVEGVVRLPKTIVARHLGKDAPLFEYGAQRYRFQQLGSFVGLGATPLPEADVSMSVVLIRAGEHSTALVTDELVGSREIVVKSLGPQISAVRGIAGATILGDGRIVVILDMGALVRSEWRAKAAETVVISHRDRRTFALVVDDSITVRRVTQRLLERNGMRVITAKDGVDAVSVLQEHLPDVILLDIEMPRMDGYEVAAHVRNDPRLKDIPIVMITSRVSEKHRARAIEIGVDDYLGKPYQENQLLDAIEPLVHRRRAVAQERG